MEVAASTPVVRTIEAGLRNRLAGGDAIIDAAATGLRQLLERGASPMLSDDIVAAVRGMANDLARQLVEEQLTADPAARPAAARHSAELAREIVRNPALLGHLHALALEWQLTQRLHRELVTDPVMPPLLQRAAASDDLAAAGQAIQLLASQARFCQSQRRMQLPLAELPGDLLHGALMAMRTLADSEHEDRADKADAAIRACFDESQNRLGLLSRFVRAMGDAALDALSLRDAGAAVFLTALGFASGQDRDLAVLSADRSQYDRLALSLRAAGLTSQAAAEQLLTLHPEASVPAGYEELSSDRAAAILASGAPLAGH